MVQGIPVVIQSQNAQMTEPPDVIRQITYSIVTKVQNPQLRAVEKLHGEVSYGVTPEYHFSKLFQSRDFSGDFAQHVLPPLGALAPTFALPAPTARAT